MHFGILAMKFTLSIIIFRDIFDEKFISVSYDAMFFQIMKAEFFV